MVKRNRRQPPTSTSPSFGHSRRAVQSARAGRSDRGRRGLQLGHDPARRSAPPRDKETIPPWRHRPAAAAPGQAAGAGRSAGGGFGARSGRERTRRGPLAVRFRSGLLAKTPYQRAPGAAAAGMIVRSERPSSSVRPRTGLPRGIRERSRTRLVRPAISMVKRNRRQPPTSTSPSFGHSRRAVQSARAGRSDRGRRGLQLGHDPARRSAPPRDKENHPAMATSASSRSAGQAAGAGRSAGGGFGARSGRERTRGALTAVRNSRRSSSDPVPDASAADLHQRRRHRRPIRH